MPPEAQDLTVATMGYSVLRDAFGYEKTKEASDAEIQHCRPDLGLGGFRFAG